MLNKFVKILGISVVVAVVSCSYSNNCYHQIEKLLLEIERNDSEKVIRIVESLRSADENLCLDVQKLLLEMDGDQKLKTWIVNPFLIKLQNIWNAHINLQPIKAENLFDEIDFEQEQENNSFFQYLLVESYVKKTFTTTIAKKFESVDPDTLSIVDFYHFLKSLLEWSKKGTSGMNSELKLGFLHYALHLIESKKSSLSFNRLKAELLFEKRFLLGHSRLDVQEYKETIDSSLMFSKSLYESIGAIDEAQLVKWYLGEFDLKDLDTVQLRDFNQLEVSKYQKLRLFSDIGIKLRFYNPKLAINAFNMALELIDNNKCLFNYAVLNNCKGFAALGNQDTLSALKYFEEAKFDVSCPSSTSDLINYINLQFHQSFLNKLEGGDVLKANHFTIFEEKEIAKRILKDDPIHLDDYMAMNGIRVLDNYKRAHVVDSQVVEEILKTVFESKGRRNKVKDKIEKRKIRNVNLTEILQQINDFKFSNNRESSNYKKAFYVLLSDWINDRYKMVSIDSLNANPILDYINRQEAQILAFLKSNDRNLGYLLNSNGLDIFEMDTPKITEVFESFYQNLNSNSGINSDIKSIKDLIAESTKLDLNIPTIVSTDGLFTQIPWHLIFNEGPKINVVNNLNRYVQESDSIVSTNSIATFSFSNDETIKSRNPKSLKELPYAHKEVNKISDILKIDQNEPFIGKSCNRNNFIKSLDSDLIHFASHASISLTNRLDNYLVLRKGASEIDKFYTYELEELGIAPKIVILSACETELGLQRDGSGTYSLANAFVQNGAQTVIKTLWKVNDKASYEFMVKLYEYWSKGISLGEAMTKTRNFFKDEDPIHWAGFVLEGNPEFYLKLN